MSSPVQHGPTGPAGPWYRHHPYALLGSPALMAGALGYVGLVDPHKPGSFFPQCPFRLLTGLNCPGCGALRMTHDVLHGDLVAAINDNVLLLVAIPLLAGWVLLRRRSGKSNGHRQGGQQQYAVRVHAPKLRRFAVRSNPLRSRPSMRPAQCRWMVMTKFQECLDRDKPK